MSASFDCRCNWRLNGPDADRVYAVVSEVTGGLDERPEVGLSILARHGASVTLELALEAENEPAARVALEEFLTTIEIALAREGVPGALARGSAAVERGSDPVAEDGADVPELMSSSFVSTLLNGSASTSDAHNGSADLRPIEDPYERMREEGTNGASYDLDTEAIIERLEAWRDEASFDVVEVGSENVTLRFDELPPDLLEFAAEAFALCPDLACEYDIEDEDGDEDESEAARAAVDAVAQGLREERVLRLWWD